MADIRIKDLATTAASTASDDFVAVDGSANGTRKLNAYSPTFGGNLTVSGTGNSSVAGNLGIGETSPVVPLHVKTTGTGTGDFDNAIATLRSTAAGRTITLQFSDTTNQSYISSKSGALNFGVGGATLGMSLSSGGNLTVSGTGNSSVAGTLLVATTTNSSNGKLQLATHTTSAGGIGFGTAISLYSPSSGVLQAYAAVAWPTLKISDDSTGSFQGGALAFGDGNSTARNVGIWRGAANSITSSGNVLNLGGYAGITFTTGAAQIGSQTTALTLDSSQNATFAGTVATTGPVTSSGAGYTNSGFKITNTSASRTTGWFLTNSGVSALRDVTGAADLFDVDLGGNGTFRGWMAVKDGVTAPSATSGYAKIYVDTADGDLKVIFGDGTVKTIVTDS